MTGCASSFVVGRARFGFVVTTGKGLGTCAATRGGGSTKATSSRDVSESFSATEANTGSAFGSVESTLGESEVPTTEETGGVSFAGGSTSVDALGDSMFGWETASDVGAGGLEGNGLSAPFSVATDAAG